MKPTSRNLVAPVQTVFPFGWALSGQFFPDMKWRSRRFRGASRWDKGIPPPTMALRHFWRYPMRRRYYEKTNGLGGRNARKT